VSSTFTSRVELLRREFDQTFAEPALPPSDETESLVVIRVGPDAYAVRVAEIDGLFADKKIVAVPTPLAELLGVAALRTGIVPVYSLGALLGQPTAGDPPRWIFAAGDVALAFDGLDGYARVAPSEIAQRVGGAPDARLRATVRVAGALCSVVSVESVLDEIKRRAGVVGTIKEP
jgi:chemotaxis signal transduction protein